ncbi:MAG TPA: HD domain-containing phosphohydrolase [Gemmatimonadaceae bacterium]|nr:HD domain-containing phosphohydrolase [Gemmatimonadaceae bacterium]
MSSNRPTVQIRAAESPEVVANIDRAKQAEKKGQWADACAIYEGLIRNPNVLNHTRLAALRWLARAYLDSGNRNAAMDVLEAAAAAAEQSHSLPAIAQALNVMAIVYQSGGDLDAATGMYKAARDRAKETGDRELLAMIDQNLGTIWSIRGELRAALDSFQASLAGYQALGMNNHEAQVLNNIGLAYTDLGELNAAEAAYEQAAQAFATDEDPNKRTVELNQIQLCIIGRRFEEASARSEELLTAEDENAPWRGEIFRHIGVIARELLNYDKASDYLGRAAAFAAESDDLLLTADVAEQRAELFWAQQRHREMLGSLNEALGLYSKFKAQHRVAQVEKRNEALEARFLEMARRWGDSIESKDRYTQGHCERVAYFSCMLATRLGMDERALFWHRIGALLHDIGKIIIPTEVLNKPDRLAPDEWELIKRHPVAGLELVADIDFPGDVRAIIRNHHERWDGKGYPDGLAGEAIPLAARILCVADVYDALTTTRSYRPGMTHERAEAIMRGSPGQFDPHLLEQFLTWAEGADIPGRPTPQRVQIFSEGFQLRKLA